MPSFVDGMRDIIAKNLRRLRHEKGWSREELPFRAKVDRSYISQLETSTYSAWQACQGAGRGRGRPTKAI